MDNWWQVGWLERKAEPAWNGWSDLMLISTIFPVYHTWYSIWYSIQYKVCNIQYVNLICLGEEGDLWGAAQYCPWEETQLQLKLQHWLWQSGRWYYSNYWGNWKRRSPLCKNSLIPFFKVIGKRSWFKHRFKSTTCNQPNFSGHLCVQHVNQAWASLH